VPITGIAQYPTRLNTHAYVFCRLTNSRAMNSCVRSTTRSYLLPKSIKILPDDKSHRAREVRSRETRNLLLEYFDINLRIQCRVLSRSHRCFLYNRYFVRVRISVIRLLIRHISQFSRLLSSYTCFSNDKRIKNRCMIITMIKQDDKKCHILRSIIKSNEMH